MNGNLVALDNNEFPDTLENREATESIRFKKMISDYFPLIERQCLRVIRQQLKNLGELNNSLNIENEALELSNLVLDTLQKDDYHVLRQFKGNSQLSTYITAIIARQAVDLIRKKKGRSREKERAEKYGQTGLIIYEQVISQNRCVSDFYSQLTTQYGISAPLNELEKMADYIEGKKHIHPPSNLSPESNPAVKDGLIMHSEEGEDEIIIPDNRNNPENLVMEEQQTAKIEKAVKDILLELNGEERFLLKMRFPTNDKDKPGKVEQIASVLGISEKAVYKRITRLLEKCRDLLGQKGVHADDLF